MELFGRLCYLKTKAMKYMKWGVQVGSDGIDTHIRFALDCLYYIVF
jgi:hypothetical protein